MSGMWKGLQVGQVALLIVGLSVQAPIGWAQPIEVRDVETIQAAVETEVERVVSELAARDPELAREFERQSQECLRDLGDGRLDHEGFTKEVETYREVRRELEDRVYQEALARDPEGAQRMREMFEATERGELMRPTPEMMERMREQMEAYLRERPEMREYAAVEWDRMREQGFDRGERFGPAETPEQAREAFERWVAESGASQADIDRMRAEMERGMREWERGMHEFERGMEMAREFERWAEGRDPLEVERYREMMEREYYYDQRLENQQYQNIERTAFEPHDGHLIDHDNDPGTSDVTHMHEIHYHADGVRHDHTGGT